ncbi:unnamed protein product, partial [Onchocerca flexuosa]|uniref:Chitinase-3-like protein 1 n=1 Tax=Onchocerca flexuosa TaxID=387005 RepID=A0A183HVT7_9BILA
AIAKSAKKRKHFIESAIAFIRKYKFDGFGLDWEYPIGVAKEHGKLVKEMKAAFVEEAKNSSNEQLLFTAAVSAKKHAIDQSYNVRLIGKHFDLLFLKSYDFHGSWEKNVDLHAKLRPTKNANNVDFPRRYLPTKGGNSVELPGRYLPTKGKDSVELPGRYLPTKGKDS